MNDYFFALFDSEENPITETSGTWSLYCSEISRPKPFTDLVLIEQNSFVSDSEGKVSINDEQPIVVDSKYDSFCLVIEADGYKLSYFVEGFKDKGNSISPTAALDIELLTESEYIGGKAQEIKEELLRRYIAEV
jgi:hypothetical protein